MGTLVGDEMTDAIRRVLETTEKYWGNRMNLPYLTDIEINDICAPLRRSTAQCRFLTGLGLLVRKKPNGRPLVARNEFERAMINKPLSDPANDPHNEPNQEAYMRLIKRGKHGA
jgi:hypothetical protein